jgi:hypothetical protein
MFFGQTVWMNFQSQYILISCINFSNQVIAPVAKVIAPAYHAPIAAAYHAPISGYPFAAPVVAKPLYG